MKQITPLDSTDCKMWWVTAFLEYGLLRPVAVVLVFLTLVCGDTFAEQTNTVNFAFPKTPSITWTNIHYVWSGTNLIKVTITGHSGQKP